jgi:hypothetical protein
LPNDLSLVAKECGMANAWYQRPKVTICYEYVDDIDKGVRKETRDGITHSDGVLGQFIYTVAHEMGHALFDTLNVPLLGRPEDAADEFAVVVYGLDQGALHSDWRMKWNPTERWHASLGLVIPPYHVFGKAWPNKTPAEAGAEAHAPKSAPYFFPVGFAGAVDVPPEPVVVFAPGAGAGCTPRIPLTVPVAAPTAPPTTAPTGPAA